MTSLFDKVNKGQSQSSVPPFTPTPTNGMGGESTLGTSKPAVPVKPTFEGIPAELREPANWMLWRHEKDPKDGKWKKVPNQTNGKHASSTKRSTWCSFTAVCAAYERGGFDGIGFAFDEEIGADGLCLVGIDFDKCINDKEVKPLVVEWIKKLDSYYEVSPSGTGFHCIVRAEPLEHPVKFGGIEIYSVSRYFTVSGHCLQQKPVRVATAEVRSLITEVRAQERAAKQNKPDSGPKIEIAPAFAHLVRESMAEGIGRNYWFDLLTPEDKDGALDDIAGVIASKTTWFETEDVAKGIGDNNKWFALTCAFARSGAPHAEDIFVKYASAAKNADPEDALREHFTRCLKDPPHGPRITIGTLIHEAQQHGADFETWKRRVPDVPILSPDKRPPLKGGKYSKPEALELLNSHYLVGITGRKTAIRRIENDGTLTIISDKEFSLEIGNILVRTGGKPLPGKKYWLEDRQRHQRVITFKNGDVGPGEYNLWRGFAIKPRPGREKSRTLLNHIFCVICRGDQTHFRYLLWWMAWKVQHPDKHPETVIVLKSEYQGTGKSTLSDVLSMIFGKHALLVDSQELLFGQFTDHLESICFIQAEEILWAGDHKTADRVKSFITGREISIHPKFESRFAIPNRLATILTTNHQHAVALGARDRRFFVLDVDTQYAGDLAYFKRLRADIDNGGAAEFLHLLLSIQLDDWHPREMVRTQEAVQQQRMSADPISQWAQECIEDDVISLGRGRYGIATEYNLGKKVATEHLYESCVASCRHRNARPPDRVTFGRACAQMFGPHQRIMDRGRRPWGYDVPNRETWQEKLDERLGIPKTSEQDK